MFVSGGDDFIASDTNGTQDTFIWDRNTQTVSLLGADINGIQPT
jgi:hypothetical protein